MKYALQDLKATMIRLIDAASLVNETFIDYKVSNFLVSVFILLFNSKHTQ